MFYSRQIFFNGATALRRAVRFHPRCATLAHIPRDIIRQKLYTCSIPAFRRYCNVRRMTDAAQKGECYAVSFIFILPKSRGCGHPSSFRLTAGAPPLRAIPNVFTEQNAVNTKGSRRSSLTGRKEDFRKGRNEPSPLPTFQPAVFTYPLAVHVNTPGKIHGARENRAPRKDPSRDRAGFTSLAAILRLLSHRHEERSFLPFTARPQVCPSLSLYIYIHLSLLLSLQFPVGCAPGFSRIEGSVLVRS